MKSGLKTHFSHNWLKMEKIKEILKNNLEPSVYLIDVKMDVHTNTIRIIVDMEEPLTLNKTAELSKTIATFPELEELYPEGYQLEVSSPGIGTGLKYPFQYKKNIGRKLDLKLEIEGTKSTITGKLLKADDQGIRVLSRKQELDYDYDSILEAVVKISFK